jgi:hypothetical protein
MTYTLITVTTLLPIPQNAIKPQYHICDYKNTFKHETMPLRIGSEIKMWGANQGKGLLGGYIRKVREHQRHWVVVEVEPVANQATDTPIHLRIPANLIELRPRTTVLRRIITPFLKRQSMPPTSQPLSPLFKRSQESFFN